LALTGITVKKSTSAKSISATPPAILSPVDFYVSYKGQQQFKGITTTLVLGNAFDKAYWSPQGIPQDGRNGKIFVSYQW